MANLFAPVIVYDNTKAEYWLNQTRHGDTAMVPLAAGLVTGSIMECHFTRAVPAGVREDQAMFRIALTVEAGPGAPMSRLDAADAARVEASFKGWWWDNGIRDHVTTQWTFAEFAWRHFGADFPQDIRGVSKAGPYWRTFPVGTQGQAAAARLPDQVALTTTLRTASRTHWGRFYMGGIVADELQLAEYGHATDALVNELATAFQQFAKDIYDDARKTWPLVWSAKYRGALAITEISVDDTYDVIRRRRAKFPTYRKTFSS